MPDIDLAYTWAIETCNAPDVGYSQAYRNQQKVGGITYYDCSSFINYALLAGGWETPGYAPNNNSITTPYLANFLLGLGFEEVPPEGENKPGDIGWVNGHTEMCYEGGQGNGIYMGAHTANAPLANQVSIGSSSGDPTYRRTWSRLFRYGEGAGGGAKPVGSSLYVVAALCGNAWRESNINPGLTQRGADGYGLFQWSGGRRTNLDNYLTEHGYPHNSAKGQVEFLKYENEWQGSFAGITSLDEFFNSPSHNIPELTEAFMVCWERPGKPFLEERIAHAFTCYTFIQNNAQDTNINTWVDEDRYLTEAEILNNAVLLYRLLTAGGGGGGKPTQPIKGMPLFMKIRYKL